MPRKTFGRNVLATLRLQPSNRVLIMDLQQAVFVRYVGFAFKWNSSLPTLNFTVDYSLDGIHWSDYVEDERVKVKHSSMFASSTKHRIMKFHVVYLLSNLDGGVNVTY